MSEFTQLLSSRWPEVLSFLLVLGRTSGLMISAPFWGGRAVPVLVRGVMAVSLSVAIYPIAKPVLSGVEGIASPAVEELFGGPSIVFLLIALGREVLLGLALGWAAQLLFAAMRLAGHEIEVKMGFGLAHLIDPQSGGQTGVLAILFDIIASLVFFSINGPLLLIRALASSYHLFPVAGEKLVPSQVEGSVLSLVEGMVTSAGEIFTIALRVSAPVVVGLLFSNLILGIMGRAVPQMNVFIVAMPLQIALGMLLVFLSLPALVWFFVNQLSALSHQLSAAGLIAG